MADNEKSTEPPGIVRTWDHSRKGRIVGVVLWSDDEWTTIRCTKPNLQAGVGQKLTFRNSLVKEV